MGGMSTKAQVLSVTRDRNGKTYTVVLSGLRKLPGMTERELDAKIPEWRRERVR